MVSCEWPQGAAAELAGQDVKYENKRSISATVIACHRRERHAAAAVDVRDTPNGRKHYRDA